MGKTESQNALVVALSTAATMDEAKEIARHLVEQRLAACVNLVPNMFSIYRWKGDVCEDSEVLLVIKTRRACLDKIKKALAALHSYDVPELVATEIADGLESYLDWVRQETICNEGTE